MTKYTFLLAIGAVAAMAGPPLICQTVDIGNAKSLPWVDFKNWNGADPSYNVAGLATDTLTILTPAVPLAVRMETLRRAAIYSAKTDTGAADLTARLTARIADQEAAGKADPNAWFDAGYFLETLRQMRVVYHYMTAAEKTHWKIRETASLDGKPWIEKAMRLGGKGMEVAIARIDDYRNEDLKRANAILSSNR